MSGVVRFVASGADIRTRSAAVALNEAEVGITDKIDLWMVAHVYRVLGRDSRVGHL
jgi:hypothetical protein